MCTWSSWVELDVAVDLWSVLVWPFDGTDFTWLLWPLLYVEPFWKLAECDDFELLHEDDSRIGGGRATLCGKFPLWFLNYFWN